MIYHINKCVDIYYTHNYIRLSGSVTYTDLFSNHIIQPTLVYVTETEVIINSVFTVSFQIRRLLKTDDIFLLTGGDILNSYPYDLIRTDFALFNANVILILFLY